MPPVEVDPFELPDWLAEGEVLWQATDEPEQRDSAATIHGGIRPLHHGDVASSEQPSSEQLSLDLLGVDVAWPKPVCDEESRHLAHEAWHYGQVVLLDLDGRVTLGVPCTAFSSDLVCEAVRRFSRAVGADAAHFLVQLRL